jgi:hypothetical protein
MLGQVAGLVALVATLGCVDSQRAETTRTQATTGNSTGGSGGSAGGTSGDGDSIGDGDISISGDGDISVGDADVEVPVDIDALGLVLTEVTADQVRVALTGTSGIHSWACGGAGIGALDQPGWTDMNTVYAGNYLDGREVQVPVPPNSFPPDVLAPLTDGSAPNGGADGGADGVLRTVNVYETQTLSGRVHVSVRYSLTENCNDPEQHVLEADFDIGQ